MSACRRTQRRKKALATVHALGWHAHFDWRARLWYAWDRSIEEENAGDVGPVVSARMLVPLVRAVEQAMRGWRMQPEAPRNGWSSSASPHLPRSRETRP